MPDRTRLTAWNRRDNIGRKLDSIIAKTIGHRCSCHEVYPEGVFAPRVRSCECKLHSPILSVLPAYSSMSKWVKVLEICSFLGTCQTRFIYDAKIEGEKCQTE